MTICQVFRFFLQTSLYFCFGIKKEEKIYYAGYCLWNKHSFRLPGNAGNDRLIGLKTLFRTLKVLWKSNTPVRYLADPPTAIIDYSPQPEILFFELKKLNVERMTRKPLGLFILKNHLLLGSSIAGKMSWTLFIGIYSAPIVLLSLFLSPKYRANGGLIITEITEIIHMIRLLKKYGIREIYDFHPYEIDSNIAALILMRAGIKVIKMPSPVPLVFHNNILIADAVVASTPYHLDEIKYFQPTFFVNEIIEWVPERALTYIERYQGKNVQTPKNTIGFYSHASWVREMEGHIDDGMHVAEAETIILSALVGYLTKNSDAHLIIFPHPREKTANLRTQTQAFYAKFFSGLSYSLYLSDEPASHAFQAADVGVMSFSTIVYERLFCGFKTLLFSYRNENFPIKDSALNNICIKNETEFHAKLDATLNSSTTDFFATHNINGYTYHNFNLGKIEMP